MKKLKLLLLQAEAALRSSQVSMQLTCSADKRNKSREFVAATIRDIDRALKNFQSESSFENKPANSLRATEAALQIATGALQDIACSSQTEELRWWQVRARVAQKLITECFAASDEQAVLDPLTIEAAEKMGAKGSEPTEAEHQLFEAWMKGHCWKVCGKWDGKTYVGTDEYDGFHPYVMHTRGLWAAWRDRAALSKSSRSGEKAVTTNLAEQVERGLVVRVVIDSVITDFKINGHGTVDQPYEKYCFSADRKESV